MATVRLNQMAASKPDFKPNARDKAWGADRKRLPVNNGQLSLAQASTWGGPRKGAGRKKRGGRGNVEHRVRPRHAWYNPVHVTLRRAKGLPGLRSERLYNELREAVRRTRRDDFRIVEFSVQRDHVHMLVEAESAAALAAGMKGFAVRAAHAINSRVLRRRGSVWGDRYHRRDLESPRDVRNAVVYVMNNPCGTTSQVAISIGVRSQTFSLRHAEGWAEGLHRRLITLVSEGRAGPAS